MKYLKRFESYGKSKLDDVVMNSLFDITDDGFDYGIEFSEDDDGLDYCSVVINKLKSNSPNTITDISKKVPFKFRDIIESVNQLISQMEGHYWDLASIEYSISSSN